jgi:glycosyltransferase involved in cell wall biosynthesis
MRVAMLLENQPYPRDVRVRSEAQSLQRAGHDVIVIAPRAAGEPRRETVSGVKVRRYRLPMGGASLAGFVLEYSLAHLQLLAGAVRVLATGAEVVHIHNPPDTLVPIGLLARLLGRKFVFDQHDLFPDLLRERIGASPLLPLAFAAQRAALRTASVILVTNDSQRELALERARLDPTRVFVVRNGPPRATLVAEPHTSDGALAEPGLVYLGELGPQDGVLALPDILRQPPLAAARLAIVGDGACRAELERRVAEDPALAGRVTFTGYLPHTEVPRVLAEADIAIDPAPASEFNRRSTMTKIAEYLAAALPVVAYDLLETRRTAADAALYVASADTAAFAAEVAGLAADPALRTRLAVAARQRAEELVWERSEKALLSAYEALQRYP